ncbi:retrovirus-related pol polyprotein from transposon TNT 1-94 [Tanacetum coccineum]
MFESRQTTIMFPSRLNDYYYDEKKGSYGSKFSKAYSYEASYIDNSIPQKEKDPGSFTLPCYINNVCFDNALVDLGASVSVMPLSTYLNLGLGELAHTKLIVELADRTVKYPKGIAKNVLVGIGKFVFLVDFIIPDMLEDVKVPLILGRPFLSTVHVKIDVFKRKITLRVGDEKIIFKSMKLASSLIKRVYMLGLRERMELDLEARLMGETLVLNRSLDPLYRDYIELNDLNEPLELRRDQVDDLMPTIKEGEVIDDPMIDIIKTSNNEKFVEYPSFCDFNQKIHIDCAYNLRFSCMIVVENMDGYRDQDMGDIILREPFCKASCVEAIRFSTTKVLGVEVFFDVKEQHGIDRFISQGVLWDPPLSLPAKRVWFEVELQGAQGDREAEVFQVSNDDTAVAQRRLEDKQPEENTNTDCLSGLSKQEMIERLRCCKEMSLEVEPQEDHTFEVEPHMNWRRFMHTSHKLSYDTLLVSLISKWKAGLKDDMDARSDVCVLSNGLLGNAVTTVMAITRSLHQAGIWITKGLLVKAKENILGLKIIRDYENGKWLCIYAVGSQEYQMVCTRLDIASADVGELHFLQVLVLKPNNFHGSIQPSFAVKSPFPCLQVLDLSRNSIEIESLDLSWNQLKGNIPQSLVGIKGNLGLCGFPLPKKCSHKPQPEEHENREDKSGFTWEVVTLGYGCGTLLGLVMGYLMLSTRKVKWFNLTADAGEHMILERNKRRYVFIGK